MELASSFPLFLRLQTAPDPWRRDPASKLIPPSLPIAAVRMTHLVATDRNISASNRTSITAIACRRATRGADVVCLPLPTNFLSAR